MGLANDLRKFTATTHASSWSRRNGTKVPEAEDIQHGNHAVDLDAVVLYADMADSTGLVESFADWFAAAVYKNYLYVAAKVIRENGGVITSYDGDRVMAVYIENSKNSDAGKTALQIKWAVDNIINPAIDARGYNTPYTAKQKVGIASSKLMAARTGIRGSNDIVWVGTSANIAAKLATLDSDYPTYIIKGVYDMLRDDVKYGGSTEQNMWTDLGVQVGVGRVYGSTWHWSIP